jgi:hypothetical protein
VLRFTTQRATVHTPIYSYKFCCYCSCVVQYACSNGSLHRCTQAIPVTIKKSSAPVDFILNFAACISRSAQLQSRSNHVERDVVLSLYELVFFFLGYETFVDENTTKIYYYASCQCAHAVSVTAWKAIWLIRCEETHSN